MHFGVSTACFYPLDTLQSLQSLGTMKIKYAEVFLNTFSELSPEYIAKLGWQAKMQDTRLLALHPFSSEMETFFFATDYATRVADGIGLYKKYFSACHRLEIKKMVFHGANAKAPFPFEKHIANYITLRKIAAEFGVDLCYENVVRCKCGTPQYITQLRDICNDDVSFVLDIKQMRRAQVDTKDMLKAMQSKIKHIHISDYNSECDCLTPGKGEFDINFLFKELVAANFAGDIIIELYENGYKKPEELCEAVKYIKRLYKDKESVL